MTPLRSLLALVLFGLPSLPAQDPEGQPAFVRVRFVGQADGLPRPGVVVHERGDMNAAARVARTGFFVVETEAVARLRQAPRTWRSDPAGEVVVPRDVLQRHGLFAAEPFVLGERKPEAGEVVIWRIHEREPVGVRALDANGAPLARFPVALHSGGRDVSVALTDDEGRALLGMPTDHTARIWLAPAGWIGPHDGMPTIVAGRDGRRGTDLVVPAHGSVLLHARRGGLPVKTRLGSIVVRLLDENTWLAQAAVQGEVQGFGFELPFVAVGARITGHVYLPDTCQFTGAGPARAGDTATIGVAVPWRPQVTFTLAGPPPWALPGPLPTPLAPHARVRFVSDAGARETSAHRDAAGHWQLDDEPALSGSRLERVEFDLFVAATADTPPRHWTACVWSCADLAAPTIDLGEVRLTASPTLHGRVVDANDQPLAFVEVIAQPPGDRGGYVLRSDADGRFVWRQPLPRDDAGNLQRVSATARTPTLRSATVPADADGGAIVLRLVGAAPPAQATGRRFDGGSLVATVVGTGPQDQGQHWSLCADSGMVANAVVTRNHDGSLELRFDRLQRGRYSLVLTDRTLHRRIVRIVCAGLDVPQDGPCTDARLARLSLQAAPRVLQIRVVDRAGVPIAGVRVTIPGAPQTTDGNGTIRIATHDPAPVRGVFEGTALRPREVADLSDGMDVVMSPATTFRVQLTGLPADVPVDRLEVWVRHEQRERFLGPRGDIAADGTVVLATPQQGRYFVNLLVKTGSDQTSRQWTLAAVRATPVDIGDGDVPPIGWQLDDAEREQLRERAR